MIFFFLSLIGNKTLWANDKMFATLFSQYFATFFSQCFPILFSSVGWLYWGFMVVGDAYVFPGFLKQVLTKLFFPKPQTTFLTCFCSSGRRKYAGKSSSLNRGSNSQTPGHESDTLTTEPPGRGYFFPQNC